MLSPTVVTQNMSSRKQLKQNKDLLGSPALLPFLLNVKYFKQKLNTCPFCKEEITNHYPLSNPISQKVLSD